MLNLYKAAAAASAAQMCCFWRCSSTGSSSSRRRRTNLTIWVRGHLLLLLLYRNSFGLTAGHVPQKTILNIGSNNLRKGI